MPKVLMGGVCNFLGEIRARGVPVVRGRGFDVWNHVGEGEGGIGGAGGNIL